MWINGVEFMGTKGFDGGELTHRRVCCGAANGDDQKEDEGIQFLGLN
jgi:hypothetical protein